MLLLGELINQLQDIYSKYGNIEVKKPGPVVDEVSGRISHKGMDKTDFCVQSCSLITFNDRHPLGKEEYCDIWLVVYGR